MLQVCLIRAKYLLEVWVIAHLGSCRGACFPAVESLNLKLVNLFAFETYNVLSDSWVAYFICVLNIYKLKKVTVIKCKWRYVQSYDQSKQIINLLI